MDGYLLDNNTLSYWFNDRVPEHAQVMERIRSLPSNTPLRTSVIVLGEVEDGHRRVDGPGNEQQARQAAFRAFIREHFPEPFDVTRETANYYGEIRSRVFRHCYPGFCGGRGRRPRPPKHPEEWVNPATGSELGVEENDIWIAAHAAERNLILVTHDRMANIRAVVRGLLEIKDWAAGEE